MIDCKGLSLSTHLYESRLLVLSQNNYSLVSRNVVVMLPLVLQ